jgi:queuine/archaeosine tRNA-ribosyltransferase
MSVFFVAAGSIPLKAFLRNGATKFLMSAYSIKYQHVGHRMERELLRGSKLIIDSGMISAWKSGKRDWMHRQEEIAEIAKRMNANYVSHLDIPVERRFLSKNHFSKKEALRISIKNAIEFMDMDAGKAKRIFVLQGWTINDYKDSWHSFYDSGIIDYIENGNHWLGVGSMCLRKPEQGLFQILTQIRAWAEGIHIHAFGIGQPDYQARMSMIGIDSTDTASVLLNWLMKYRRATTYASQSKIDGLNVVGNEV